jgi:cellobiose dehydrogenase (acceptor)
MQTGGIGPADQLDIVKSSSDGPTMIDKSAWINLPVGNNLVDHVNVRLHLHDRDSTDKIDRYCCHPPRYCLL